MKSRLFVFIVVFVLGFASTALSASAQQPSSKTAVQVSNVALLSATSTTSSDWVDLLSTSIKTPNQKDLLMLVSLECGLYAKTVGKSSKTATTALDSQMASSGVKVRVLVDGTTVAEPGEVVFCRKTQTLNSSLATALSSCVDGSDGSVPDGIIQITECTATDSEIQLILDSMDANAFNFALTDLSAGTHQVKVQGFIDINLTAGSTNVEAKAAIGKGAVIVEEVRLIKNADITLP